jgi:trigger factor
VKTTLSERDGNTVKLDVEVSSEELQEAFDARVKKLAREVRLPGFRPGKAPVAMIRQRFGDEGIVTEAVEDKIGDWFALAATEAGLDVVERPSIEIGDEVPVLGQPLKFTATCTVMPEVELGRYTGLEVPKDLAEVEDDEVNTQVERMRNEGAELRPVTGRAAQNGDFVTVDFGASHNGEPVPGLEATDFVFEVGSGRLFPEIEVQTIGMNIDEERTFDFVMPKEIGGDEEAGQTVDFTTKLKEIKEKVLPEISDKWASEVSEFETLLELRLDLRARLAAQKAQAADQKFRQSAVQAAVNEVTIDIPDAVIVESAQGMVQDFARSLASQGGDLNGYFEAAGTTLEQMIEDFKPTAEREVKTGLVLDAIAKAEKLAVTDEDIDGAFAEMATASRADAATIRNTFEKANRLESVKWQILREKTVNFVTDNSVAVAPVEPAVDADVAEAAPVAEDVVAEAVEAQQNNEAAETETVSEESGTTGEES